MTAEPVAATLTIEGNRLTVRGEVAVDDSAAFGDALARLIESGEKRVVVDATGIQSVRSVWIGVLAAAMARARARGVKMKVLGTPKATAMFDAAGLAMLGEIRSVKE